MSRLLTPADVPAMPGDGATLSAAADTIATNGPRVGDGVLEATIAWSTLPTWYDAPETTTAVAAMAPLSTAAMDFSETSTSVAAALSALGETLQSLETTRDALIDDIVVHQSTVAAYRASEAADYEDPSDPLAGWGPYGYARNEELWERCTSLRARLTTAVEECEQDLRRIGQPSGVDSVARAGSSAPAGALDWTTRDAQFRTTLALAVLDQFTSADGSGIRQLLAEHPEWVALLRDSPPEPHAINAWWTGLDPAAAAALAGAAPAIVGGLGGVPAAARVAANRTTAEARLRELDKLIDGRGYTYQPGTYERVRIGVPDDWREERDYLERVVAGDVQLYQYDRQRGQIIEMIGDPDNAVVLMTFMPGTNTTMDSFYTSSSEEGITAIPDWAVNRSGVAVAAFVVKQGAFPQLSSDLISTGPQNNEMTEKLGQDYARFSFELDAIAPKPIVSVEHSAGSAAGGAAETAGADFDARILLAGIGMTADWQPQPGTDYYAMQAPNDINKNFDGVQVENWGYAITPTEGNGITELPSGIPGTSSATLLAGVVSPALGIYLEGSSQLEHHNQVISGNPNRNSTVLRNIRDILNAEVQRQ